jgi:hypothetical protein
MGMITGAAEYAKWKRGLSLTLQEAIDAHCYICNNREDEPCTGANCTLHQFSPFKPVPGKNEAVNG